MKGDVVSKDFLLECKRTDKQSLSIKKEWIDKISKEATSIGKEWAVHIDIQDSSYIIISEDMFKQLIQTKDE